jgi:formylmethanofuran dehydrogenase subunit E
MALPVPDKNPSLDDSGNMITKEEGKPAPEGRVWCDVCGGHFPKEDAVSVAGKTMCPADAEEAKGG